MDAKLKHLEFIEAAIGRMATNSFLFKGWAITLASGLGAFGAVDRKAALFAIALTATLLFWGLDGYYLWLERGFINLYSKVATQTEAEIDFVMTIDKPRAARRWFKTCWRPHLVAFYGVLAATTAVGIFVVGSK